MIGTIVKQYRTAHNLSTRRFADLCNLTCGYISMIENGRNPRTGKPIAPNLETLSKLAKGMGITLDELIQKLGDKQRISLSTTMPPVALPLTVHEADLLEAYRAHPEMQPAIDKMLDIAPAPIINDFRRFTAITGDRRRG